MDEPWFITYRGRAKFQMTPANAKGWVALIATSLVSIVPTIATAPFFEEQPLLIAVPLLTLPSIWLLFIRWALSKSEVINIDELLAERRAQQRGDGHRKGDGK